MNRFTQTMRRLRSGKSLGLFPYLTAGFPDAQSWTSILDLMVECGADGLEVGMPFSDPLADGVTLQRAGAHALEQGITLKRTLTGLAEARPAAPVALMSYVNPLLAYGLAALGRDAAASGVDAFIVPDLPLGESAELRSICAANDLGYVPMVAPTSTDDHLRAVNQVDATFVYCVALLGVTGARTSLDENLGAFLTRVRSLVQHPLVVGFGISRPEHVTQLHDYADGAIVASAIADIIEQSGSDAADGNIRAYLTEMKSACLPKQTTQLI
ncbi:MAG: tryptophan synthase subunit alpha [Chloroflexota bacterium]